MPSAIDPSAQPPLPRQTDAQSWKLTLLLDSQSIDWQRGGRPQVETYLQRRPDLRDDPEVILHLVYHEVLLRRRLGGEEPTLAEYLERFPHLAEALTVQFALDQALPFEESHPDAGCASTLPHAVQVTGYDVLEVLGRGGMGVVYRARQRALNRTVALKMILDGAHCGPRAVSRFRTEAEVIARLQHPSIVQIHEIGEHDGRPYLALEYVEGGTLERTLAGTPLPIDRASRLVETLARALEHAHDRGVVHRDLKPSNVLLTTDLVPKITDFGLAKLLAGDSRQTESGALVGTPSYMAPEQVDGPPAGIGPATDIYALGAILYEVLTGRPPFRGESPMATMLQVRGSDVVPPRHLRPGLPRDLETICLKSLEKDPRRRYQTAAALADDLSRQRDGRPIVARPVPAWERLWLWARRQRALAAGVILAMTAVLALLAGGIYHNIQLSSSNRALEAARAASEQNAREALATITQLLVRVADERLSDVPEAEPVRRDLLRDALSRLEPLHARNPADPAIRQEMGRSYLGIAGIHRALGEFASAEEQCRKALAILDPLLDEHPLDKRLQDSVVDAHAALAQWLGPERGRDDFSRAVAILEPRARHDHAAAGKLATVYYSAGYAKGRSGPDDSVGYCEKAIALLEPLARDEPLTYGHDLARALFNLGLAEARQGHLDSSVNLYRRCLRIWDSIPADLRTEADREGIATCQDALGLSLVERPSPERQAEAERILRQAVESFRELARRHPRLLRHRARLSQAWSNLGSFYWKAGRLPDAEATYTSALAANQENFHDFPEDSATRLWLAHCLQNLADTQGRLNKTKEAREGFEKALAVIDPLVSQTPHEFGVLQCVGIICLNYGNMVKLQSGAAAALALQERCVRSFEEANRVEPNDAEARRCLLGARGNLCTTLEDLKQHDLALAQIDASLPLCNAQESVIQRFLKGLIQARAGRHEPATAEARSLAKEPGLPADTLYNLACIHSLSVAAALADSGLLKARQDELAATYRREAIGLIERSITEGKFPKKELLEQLSKDNDMDPIRGSQEFKHLLARIAK